MRAIMALTILSLGVPAYSKSKPRNPPAPLEKEFNPATATFKEVLDRYVFVADFNQKPAERPITTEYMWKYPFKPGPVKFQLDLNTDEMRAMVYQVKGSGPKAEVFNIGRVAFMEGDHERAHEIWLKGRQDFKDDAVTNRAFEFFMGVNALTVYQKKVKSGNGVLDEAESKRQLQRAAYFLASSFILRKDVAEERISRHAAWGLYNLAVIYYLYDRIPSVYGAATEGLATLLAQGKNYHRPHFRQLLAETHIRNQDPISAIQELDTAIRQDPEPIEAAKMFNRVADIYYDLNNYELAIDMYAMAGAIDRERLVYNPAQALLRAESLFWLGRFEESANTFKGAVDHSMRTAGNEWLHQSGMLPWAWLRVADARLIEAVKLKDDNRKKAHEAARLAYFKVQADFPKTEAARVAEVRGACMELPRYEGNNVKHSRDLLRDAKEKKDLPEILTEMIWACEAQSYVDREKTDVMVEKVREFSDRYPQSKFLDGMLDPVRDVNARKIEPYFAKKRYAEATEFFEAKRSVLFPKVSRDLGANLWIAYVETSRPKQAAEFWRYADKGTNSDEDVLRRAAYLFEIQAVQPDAKTRGDLADLNRGLKKRAWKKGPTKLSVQFLKRIMVTKDVSSGYYWILNLVDAWSNGENADLCEVKFPLWSRIHKDPKSSDEAKRAVFNRFAAISDKAIADEKDLTCQQSLLDFEAKITPFNDLSKKYAQRAEWPLTGAWLDRTWTWAEELHSRGQRDAAVAAWKSIAEKGPADAFETKMAKQRLDPRKTEFESLWKK